MEKRVFKLYLEDQAFKIVQIFHADKSKWSDAVHAGKFYKVPFYIEEVIEKGNSLHYKRFRIYDEKGKWTNRINRER